MDKHTNEAIYRQKQKKLCVIPLCIIAARLIFRFAKAYLPTGRTLVSGDAWSPEWHYEWYYYAFNVIEVLTSLASFVCIVILVSYLWQRSRSCKNCMAWNSMKKVSVQLLDVRATTIRQTSRDKVTHYDHLGMSEIGHSTIERTHDVPAEQRTSLVTYQCSCCGYTHDKTVTSIS